MCAVLKEVQTIIHEKVQAPDDPSISTMPFTVYLSRDDLDKADRSGTHDLTFI